VLCAALAAGWPGGMRAEELTLDQALARAREKSADVLAARRRLAEAMARLEARPSLRDNPTIEGAYGSRQGSTAADFEVGISQTFELGGRGGARRAAGEASVQREQADAAHVERTVLRDVRIAFLRGLHAADRQRLARSVETDALELERVARRRHEAGDVAALDVNVARSALSRARADVKTADAAGVLALSDLRALLDVGPSEPLSLAGDLRGEGRFDPAALAAGVRDRPEIRALEAQLREAEAEVRLGKGLTWPDLAPAVRYEQDQGDRILWAGLSISLPVFDRGQQARAVGSARSEGLRAEIEARRRTLENQVHGAVALHDLRLAAVKELSANAETLADSEALARRSYEVGQIGLGELLLVRREAADARRQWLDGLLELAQVRSDLDSLAGGAR
jgi:cobalt-zinc-cadmium efflux system outer membrane protein